MQDKHQKILRNPVVSQLPLIIQWNYKVILVKTTHLVLC